ncbi:MAG: glycoside hydrolase family 130 protein [Clostridia bacterium]|nr:glycoside hydrolase family 130 protein [Clostridia bacterium]
MNWKDSGLTKRYENNPVLSKKDVPYPADLVFNAGVTKYRGKYYMIFRNDYLVSGSPEEEKFKFGTNIGIADSDDGVHWSVRKENLVFNIDREANDIRRFYDPRLTVIEDTLYFCFAVDTHHGIRGGIGKIIGDFESVDVLSISAPDNRNMVLFPEKINGLYWRLERPFPVYSRGGKDRFDTWISASPDLRYWGDSKLLQAVEEVPFSNDKIGPGAPPVKTDAGWLVLTHSVERDDTIGKNGWEKKWPKRYYIGLLLLDLKDPTKVIGMSKEPLMVPTAPYETDGGFRNDVLFPGGAILEEDGTLKIYYGSADAVECLATAKVQELIEFCK